MKKIVNNIPNAITISRIISCLLGAVFFTTGNIVPSLCFYVYGAVSDACDGFLARKLNAVSEFGKKLDPISDKLYALSLMVPSIILGNYFMTLPLIFEGIISTINIYSEVKYKSTHTEKVGKLKTIMLFPTMILGLISTLEPYFYLAFMPSLLITAKLQAKSMLAYMEQLEKAKRECDNRKLNEIENIELKKESKDSYKNTLSLEKNKSNSNNKIKKLVRKKDYNDRY